MTQKMSHDRIKFELHRMQTREFRDLVQEVFGFSLPSRNISPCEAVTVICRPSQFARFLVLRNSRGFSNDFKGLNAELFTPSDQPETVDVSGNPNTVRSKALDI
jgi:hypothetical protein